MTRWRQLYGDSPLQLAALAASFALAGYAASKLISGGHAINVLAWFVVAIIGHDFVLFPLYSGLDRLAGNASPRASSGAINFVRAPAMFSGLLLLVYFPSILGLNASNYRAATSLNGNVYLARWLLITAALFAGSGLLCAVTVRRRGRAQPASTPAHAASTAATATPDRAPPVEEEPDGDGPAPPEKGRAPPPDAGDEPMLIESGDERATNEPANEAEPATDRPFSGDEGA